MSSLINKLLKDSLEYITIKELIVSVIISLVLFIVYLFLKKKTFIVLLVLLIVAIFNRHTILMYIFMNEDNEYIVPMGVYLIFYFSLVVKIPQILKIRNKEQSLFFDLTNLIISILAVIYSNQIPYFQTQDITNFTSQYAFMILQFTSIFISAFSLYKCKSLGLKYIFYLALSIQILLPYILLSRTNLVFYFIKSSVDFFNIQTFHKISLDNHFYIITIFLTALIIFEFQCFKKLNINNNILFIVAISLIFSDLNFQFSRILFNPLNFSLLPNTPCAIYPLLLLIYLESKNKTIYTFLLCICEPLFIFNTLFLFTGKSNNFFSYLTLSSIFFHIYGFACGNLLYKHSIKIKFKSIFSCLIIFLGIQLTFNFIGNLQEHLELKYHIDLAASSFYGFLYGDAPISSLRGISLAIPIKIGFMKIYWINTLIILIGIGVISISSYLIENRLHENTLDNQMLKLTTYHK
jgi:hypothetical protein